MSNGVGVLDLRANTVVLPDAASHRLEAQQSNEHGAHTPERRRTRGGRPRRARRLGFQVRVPRAVDRRPRVVHSCCCSLCHRPRGLDAPEVRPHRVAAAHDRFLGCEDQHVDTFQVVRRVAACCVVVVGVPVMKALWQNAHLPRNRYRSSGTGARGDSTGFSSCVGALSVGRCRLRVGAWPMAAECKALHYGAKQRREGRGNEKIGQRVGNRSPLLLGRHRLRNRQ